MKPSNKQAYERLVVLKCVLGHALAHPPRSVWAQCSASWSEEECRELEANARSHIDETITTLRKLGIWKHASPKEQAFLQCYGLEMDDYEHKAAGWRMECVGVIMWALGLIEQLPPIDEQTSIDLLKIIPIQKVSLFSKHPALRAGGEIAAQRDDMEFWHWRARTRQLIEEGRPFEAFEGAEASGIRGYDDIVRKSATEAYKRGMLSEIMEEDFVFMGKPFRALSQDEYANATSIVMERHYALNWLCGFAPGNRWDETPMPT